MRSGYRNIQCGVCKETGDMATKSILKNINIDKRKFACMFVEVLGKEDSKYRPIKLSRECRELTGDKLKVFFQEK